MLDNELASSNELVDNREGLLVKEGKVVVGGYQEPIKAEVDQAGRVADWQNNEFLQSH